MTPPRTYGWAGVSSREQAKSAKESIPAQKREIQAAAERMGVTLADIMEVPGFSRDYIEFHDCRDDMLKHGIDAFARLEQLWKARAIDLLLVRDADRFGRTLSILATVGASLIESGAKIYLTSKNIFIDKKNYPTLLAIFGLMSQDEIDRLRARYEVGMAGRYKMGLPSTRLPFSHVYEAYFEGSEKRQRLVLDHTKDRFWADLKDLLLGGVPYHELGGALAKRGHRNPANGRRFGVNTLWRHLHCPSTWGHLARFRDQHGPWAYDETLPLPEGTEVQRNRIEPVWSGRDADLIKAELRRRSKTRGRARPGASHRFAGLLVCAECGYPLSYVGDGPRYYCPTRWVQRRDDVTCTANTAIKEATATEQIQRYLERALAADDVNDLFVDGPKQDNAARLAKVDQELADVDAQLRRLIRLQVTVPESVAYAYTDEIHKLGAHLEALQAERLRLQNESDPPDLAQQRRWARDEIAGLSPAAFLAAEDTIINQVLHRLMGPVRFIVHDGQIVDADEPRKNGK